ncbi:MAG: NAD(P)H-dependent oxidoreductase subunit E [Treponema sp.]|nr:NAD(P)H-dependent oxidoreductase subunit E [Treponema sp.]
MERYGNAPQQLLAILLDIQEESGNNCVEKQWAELASEVLKIPLSKIYDVLTFYAMFNLEPQSEYIIEICRSSPCFFNRAQDVINWFEKATGIKMGESSADGIFSLAYTNCVGACDIGPVAVIGDDVFGNLTEEKVTAIVKHCRDRNKRELSSLCQN